MGEDLTAACVTAGLRWPSTRLAKVEGGEEESKCGQVGDRDSGRQVAVVLRETRKIGNSVRRLPCRGKVADRFRT